MNKRTIIVITCYRKIFGVCRRLIKLSATVKYGLQALCIMAGLLVYIGCLQANQQQTALNKAPIDLTDPASLQRGAKIFMNQCSGCHSLKYVRYRGMAQDIGIVDRDGKVYDELVKHDLMFTGNKLEDPILTAMSPLQGKNWFGISPPDLSLVTRSRGVDWLYAYLRSFYADPKRPWGVNNKIFPDVAMPHVLANVQQSMSPTEYDAYVADLVNFLAYVGEPVQLQRKRLGVWVLLFLGVFFVFAFLLKREYWKDVH